MKLFLINIILGLSWAAFSGRFSHNSFLIGFAIGYFILWFASPIYDQTGSYFNRVKHTIWFIGYFIKELIISSLRVAITVISPRMNLRPGVLAVPLDAKTDLEITLLANFISLTPGTLSIDVSDDHKTLYIHSMFISKNVERDKKEIKNGMERRLLKALR